MMVRSTWLERRAKWCRPPGRGAGTFAQGPQVAGLQRLPFFTSVDVAPVLGHLPLSMPFEAVLADHETYISGRGAFLDFVACPRTRPVEQGR